MTSLQDEYNRWQTKGLDLAFAFVLECANLARQILDKQRCKDRIEIENDATFESIWFDDHNRLCCAAMIDDRAPMGWRVEFLDLHLKKELHDLLTKVLNEYTTA